MHVVEGVFDLSHFAYLEWYSTTFTLQPDIIHRRRMAIIDNSAYAICFQFVPYLIFKIFDKMFAIHQHARTHTHARRLPPPTVYQNAVNLDETAFCAGIGLPLNQCAIALSLSDAAALVNTYNDVCIHTHTQIRLRSENYSYHFDWFERLRNKWDA